MVMNRKGVSPVIATVLLLVLTIVLASIIFSLVIPFVDDTLSDSKSCLEIMEGIEFADSEFNCYISSTTPKTGFSVKINKEKVAGLKIGLTDANGNSDVIDWKSGMNPILPSTTFTLNGLNGAANPGYPSSVGSQRTYVVNKEYKKGEISAVSEKGDLCPVADVVEFIPCIGVNL